MHVSEFKREKVMFVSLCTKVPNLFTSWLQVLT